MDSSELREVAEQAGVDEAYLQRLIELGVVTEATVLGRSGTRYVKVIQSIEAGGIPLEMLARAIVGGHFSLDFVEQPSYEILAAYGTETFRDVAQRTGLPLDALLAVREVMGSAPADADDRMRLDELEVVPLLEVQVAAGARPAVTQLRVSGDALRRVADTEADWWRSEILEPLIRAGTSGARLGELTAELATGMEDARDQALLAIYHAHEAHAWMRNIFEGLETLLEQAGIRASVARLPAIAFLDLTGYTRLTAQEGDEAGADLARRLGPLVQRLSSGHGGRPVKWLGDGVMFHFPEPAGAVLAALRMVEAAATERLPPARVGIHAGPVLYQEGDYFGRTVNVAARMSDYARPGEVLVTQEVVDSAGDAPVVFSGIGSVELKGLPLPIALFLARDGTSADG